MYVTFTSLWRRGMAAGSSSSPSFLLYALSLRFYWAISASGSEVWSVGVASGGGVGRQKECNTR
jgi:hypothetical protein